MNLDSPYLPYIYKHESFYNKFQKSLFNNDQDKNTIHLIEGYQG
jgi:hypothetical protein